MQDNQDDDRKIVSINVVHMPHISIDTGIRHLTLENARIEVSVTLEGGEVKKFAVIRTPRRGVRKEKKIDMAIQGFEPIVGMRWVDVRRVALRFQFLPLGIPWGISYSGTPRWFKCFCDGNTQVSKDIWRQYQDKKQIQVTCDHCTLTQYFNQQEGEAR